MVVPLVKLGALAMKTVSKPIANILEKKAGCHPKFRQFAINLAQVNHRVIIRLQRGTYGRVTDASIRPLDEEKAVQTAAGLLGGLFVFTVAGAVAIFEVQKNEERKKAEMEEAQRKDELRSQEIQVIKTELKHLAEKVEEQQRRAKHQAQMLEEQQRCAKRQAQKLEEQERLGTTFSIAVYLLLKEYF